MFRKEEHLMLTAALFFVCLESHPLRMMIDRSSYAISLLVEMVRFNELLRLYLVQLSYKVCSIGVYA